MDDGAGRYFGTLYGVLALLRSKGLAGPEDMNDLASYSDLASKAIVKVANLSRKIAIASGLPSPQSPPMADWPGSGWKASPEQLRKMHKELLEAVTDLETMAGPTAIVDKIQDEVSDHMSDMEIEDLDERRSRFTVIDGDKPMKGDEDGSSDT